MNPVIGVAISIKGGVKSVVKINSTCSEGLTSGSIALQFIVKLSYVSKDDRKPENKYW